MFASYFFYSREFNKYKSDCLTTLTDVRATSQPVEKIYFHAVRMWISLAIFSAIIFIPLVTFSKSYARKQKRVNTVYRQQKTKI